MYQTTTANPSSGVIILQGSENYLEWIYTIEMASRKVWKYINPARTSQEIAATPIGSTPRMPLPSDVRDGVQRISQLTAGPEMEEYKMMMLSWREAKADFGEIDREFVAFTCVYVCISLELLLSTFTSSSRDI
ncbi:hypothetical protein K3495_g16895 [Podosphaera aphanis]|nr:hypothetical protein K3495_g16895 [Podosphaera aphanis]